ncbi:MAG: alpha/beta fold hydrolase, partial [Anaerolineae bacterium]|nr:alpha/beta fold hydrolase [Anaerolineae bacterium]
MKHAAILIALVLLLALAGCSGAAPSPVVQVTEAPTEQALPTEAPTEEPTQAPAAEQPDQAASEEKGQFDYNIIDAAQLPVTFPFKEVASHVVVDVAFGDDAPLPFMFDTGASTFVTQDIANVHGGDVLGQVPSEAGGGQMMMNDLQAYPSVMVGDSVEIRDMFALAPWDVANNTLYCVTPYGLLGSSALYQAVWQIDYGTNEITAAASVDQLDHIDGAMVLDFTPQEGLSPTPFVELPVGNGTLKFLVDTGGGLSIAINPADAASVGIEAPEDAPTISSRASGAAGSFDITRKVVNVPITLGDREITYPVTINEGMAPGAAGNIGHDFLKNFVVTFDWSTNKIYLDPIAEDGSVSAPKPPLDAGLGWDGQHVVVNGIVKGSAAAEAGLVGGEVVTNVNGESVEGFTLADFCDLANAGGVEAVTTEDGNTHPVNRVEDFYEGAGAPAAETSMAESEDAAAGSTFGEAWESVDCVSIDVAPTVAAIADCGYVTVPANRANGSDQIIKLAVARVHSPSESPDAPIFLATGGPGGYGFGSIQTAQDATNWPQSNATVLADHDWVFFTQRGTPGAKPDLSCPPFDVLSLDASKNGWTEDQVVAETTKRIQTCYDEFVKAGVNFADFNSFENAEDVNAIREALGYDKIIFYGESYGTQLGQYVMRQHPEILQAVALDGVVPVEFTAFAQVTNTTDGFKRALDACIASPDCDKTYPNLESTLEQAYDALNANPAPVQTQVGSETVTLHVNGLNLLNALFTNIYSGGVDVPRLIYGARDNDPAVLAEVAPRYDPRNRSASLMNFAVNCSDDPSTSPDEFKHGDVLPMYTAIALDFAQR